MGNPVVHFEINSGAPQDLRRFYANAFGWSIEVDGDGYANVKTEGVCPGSGFPGIDGGIGQSDDGEEFVTFYIQVPEVEAALAAVEKLGGNTILEPLQAGNVVLAHFRDPRDNRIGLVRAEPA
jgi:predicted enzyme related to lactoylglutathione lyase